MFQLNKNKGSSKKPAGSHKDANWVKIADPQ